MLHGLLLVLLATPGCIKSGGEATSVEVNIVEKQKIVKQAPILPTSPKPLIPGRGAGKAGKAQQVDMTQYANQVKAAVDPIWLEKVSEVGLQNYPNLTTEVLLFPDKYGTIINVRVVKSSGNGVFDSACLIAIREVHQLPKPPEVLVKEGILYEFSTGQ